MAVHPRRAALILSVVVLLSDRRPADATWLEPEERVWPSMEQVEAARWRGASVAEHQGVLSFPSASGVARTG